MFPTNFPFLFLTPKEMGPKAAAEPVGAALKEGANLVYIQCSLGEGKEFVAITINLNCRVDIILDSAKRLLLKEIEARLLKTQNELANPEILREETKTNTENSEEPVDAVAIKTALKERLDLLHTSIREHTSLDGLELQDEGGTSINVRASLSQNGVEALKPSMKYIIGTVDENAFTPF
jgi:hypothetical protein